ncbi:ABC transporter ATP-binding protein [Taibaiella koreensis]|uniref:ABC transporter ATP-binding protein n=1 Tax=Taibaiella koreensis TaxID=1268548 RepID=UPI000E59E394|nr:ABC transporter ATP-binding protein [Taibaiella koreensis]
MTISLNQVSKRYQNHWVFKGLSYTFEAGRQYALLGANGSGKSTLLRIVGGMQHASKGQITYSANGQAVAPEKIFSSISYCAPGMDLVEEMVLTEFLRFHFTFKRMLPSFSIASIIEHMGLKAAAHKQLHEYSSGMKQRVKLAQAFFCDSPVLLLDEPCSNLDGKGVEMYSQWLRTYGKDRLVIIASNDEREYEGVSATLSIEDYKQF